MISTAWDAWINPAYFVAHIFYFSTFLLYPVSMLLYYFFHILFVYENYIFVVVFFKEKRPLYPNSVSRKLKWTNLSCSYNVVPPIFEYLSNGFIDSNQFKCLWILWTMSYCFTGQEYGIYAFLFMLGNDTLQYTVYDVIYRMIYAGT